MEGLARAKRDADTARAKLGALHRAVDAHEGRQLWSELLEATYRCYEKLKAAVRGNPEAQKWFAEMAADRRDDPLLCYVHHARNADSHGLREIAPIKPGGAFIPGGDFIHIRHLSIVGGQILHHDIVDGAGRKVLPQFEPGKVQLVDVVDRGVSYPVPREHMGKPVEEPTIARVGGLAVAYLDRKVGEAATL